MCTPKCHRATMKYWECSATNARLKHVATGVARRWRPYGASRQQNGPSEALRPSCACFRFRPTEGRPEAQSRFLADQFVPAQHWRRAALIAARQTDATLSSAAVGTIRSGHDSRSLPGTRPNRAAGGSFNDSSVREDQNWVARSPESTLRISLDPHKKARP